LLASDDLSSEEKQAEECDVHAERAQNPCHFGKEAEMIAQRQYLFPVTIVNKFLG
jgi:hypothetical protein